jgi:Protein of unknown function (DUF3106)
MKSAIPRELIVWLRMRLARPAVMLLTLASLGGPTSLVLAQQSAATPTTPSPTLNKSITPELAAVKLGTTSKPAPNTKPSWAELSPAQHNALKPLAGQWTELGLESKRKWLAISRNYESLSPTEQVKLHSRMSAWVSLSTLERTEARLNFAETQKLPADEKAAHWHSYQELSAEEKRKLAAQAPGKPSGIAVSKPTPQKKLAEVPVTPHAPQQGAKLAGSTQAVNPNTLLPHRPAPAEAKALQKQ